MADSRDIATLWRDTLADGGATVYSRTLGDVAPTGWAVGQSHGIATVTFPAHPARDAFVHYTVLSFWGHISTLRHLGVPHIGTWLDNGVVHVDAVDIIHDTDRAIAECLARGEEAIYNLATGVTLRPSR